MKHLLKLLDCSTEEIIGLLDLADQLKYEKKHNISHRHLEGKSLGMIFQKSSTRTRVSFETGMYQLGGQALFLSNRDLQIGRGEPVQDTARVLSRYLDGIMIRTYAQKEVEDLADYGSVPVINGLTDFCHPCQVLADLMTIREKFAVLEGLKMCSIGCRERGRCHHGHLGFHGHGGRKGGPHEGVQGLSSERRAACRGQAGLHGAALSACVPRAGDHDQGV